RRPAQLPVHAPRFIKLVCWEFRKGDRHSLKVGSRPPKTNRPARVSGPACRHFNGRSARRAALEVLEELTIRRHYERRAVLDRFIVRLEGPVEREELRILPISSRVDLVAFGVAFTAENLRLLVRFGEDDFHLLGRFTDDREIEPLTIGAVLVHLL